MAQIGQAIFLNLAGKPPADIHLPALQTAARTSQVIRGVFQPFIGQGVEWLFCEDFAQIPLTAASGVSLVYLMGHAWLRNETYCCGIQRAGNSIEITGTELLDYISPFLTGPAVLIVDTCHAAAFAPLLEKSEYHRVAAIFASASHESALEFPFDAATRFALTLKDVIARSAPSEVDMASVAYEIAKRINSSAVVAPQTVSHLPARPPIVLAKSAESRRPRARSRTYTIVRSLLIGSGAVAATAAGLFAWFVWSRIQVEISSPVLSIVDGPFAIEIRRQQPETNTNEQIQIHQLQPGSTLRLWLPAEDLLFVTKATFRDGRSRAIRFHLVSQPSFAWSSKFLRFQIPGNDEIVSHPDMAYIPAASWIAGSEKTTELNKDPFWIDLYPTTVAEYLPFAEQAVADGTLQDYESVLIYESRAARATAAVGLGQLAGLASDLSKIFNVIEAPAKATRQPTPSERLPNARIPCDQCPAPMTMKEARQFCEAKGKRLPTDHEWELAARGVDGRLYPWGNRFEKSRANVIGLPDKGEPFKVRGVREFPSGESPFGMLDSVGNAGDWIDSQGGYERTYIGGTYRFDPQNTLVYSTMPDTGDPLPQMEVTCRCVSASQR